MSCPGCRDSQSSAPVCPARVPGPPRLPSGLDRSTRVPSAVRNRSGRRIMLRSGGRSPLPRTAHPLSARLACACSSASASLVARSPRRPRRPPRLRQCEMAGARCRGADHCASVPAPSRGRRPSPAPLPAIDMGRPPPARVRPGSPGLRRTSVGRRRGRRGPTPSKRCSERVIHPLRTRINAARRIRGKGTSNLGDRDGCPAIGLPCADVEVRSADHDDSASLSLDYFCGLGTRRNGDFGR